MTTLPLYATESVGTMQGRTGDTFLIYKGLSADVVAELKKKSLDESDVEIQNNTSDRERFGLGSYEEWYSKERTPFALIHESTGDLAGLAWFGPKPLGRKSLKHLSDAERAQDERLLDAGDWHTIVYRSYPPFRGAGLMKTFVRMALSEYMKQYPGARIWAGIHSENPASVGFATALGFSIDEELSDRKAHHFVMILPEGVSAQ